MTIVFGSDHAGYELKEKLKEHLINESYNIEDKGTSTLESTDYPDYAHDVAKMVELDESSLGVLICGSANGVCMTANKYQQVRAAIAWRPDIAKLAKTHNNANILCIPARFVSESDAINILDAFLGAVFEGGRHKRRVEKIAIC